MMDDDGEHVLARARTRLADGVNAPTFQSAETRPLAPESLIWYTISRYRSSGRGLCAPRSDE